MSSVQAGECLRRPTTMTEAPAPSAAVETASASHRGRVTLGGGHEFDDGPGRSERDVNVDHEDPLELELMREIKDFLDSAGPMNPRKVLRA